MDLVKSGQFSRLFIFGKIGKENALDNILESQKAFLDYKKVETLAFFQRGYSMVFFKNG